MEKKWIGVLALVLAIIGRVGVRSIDNKDVKDVRVASVIRENLVESVRVEGTIVPKKSYNLYTEVPLVVGEVLVSLGQEVSAGDVLIKFSEGSVESVKNDIRILDLDLENARLELSDLESGSMKLDLDSRLLEIERLENQVKSLRRNEKIAKSELENVSQEAEIKVKLFEMDGISSLDVNAVKSRKARSEMEYEDIKTELLLLQARYSLAVLGYDRLKRELMIQKNMVESRIEKYGLSMKQLKGRFIRELVAPVDGVVSSLDVENGSPVTSARKIMTIVIRDDFVVKADIPATIIEALDVGMDADILSRDNYDERVYKGRIKKISHVIKSMNRGNYEEKLVEIELDIENPVGLKAGSPVDIDILGNRMEMITVVDAFSVLEESGRNYVFIIEDGVARKQEVSVGVKTSSKYQVLNLPEGAEIVRNPFAIRNGEKTRVVR